MPREQLDGYENLILLCAADHRKIDEQPGTYSVQELHRLKREHEQWVQHTLTVAVETKEGSSQATVVRVSRIDGGQDLLAVLDGAHALSFEHPEPKDEAEVDVIAEVSQEVRDWLDIQDVIGAADRVRFAFRLTSLIKGLADHGLTVCN